MFSGFASRLLICHRRASFRANASPRPARARQGRLEGPDAARSRVTSSRAKPRAPERVEGEGGMWLGNTRIPSQEPAHRRHAAHRGGRADAPSAISRRRTTATAPTSSTRTGLFLDPIICVTAPERLLDPTHAPGCRHAPPRRARDHRAVVPKMGAWHILALNTEKAAQPARKIAGGDPAIYQRPVDEDASPRVAFASNLEEPQLAARPVLRANASSPAAPTPHRAARGEVSDEPLKKSLPAHERTAQQLMDLDARVTEAAVGKLKARGFVTRTCAPSSSRASIRCAGSRATRRPLEEFLKTMRERAAKFTHPTGQAGMTWLAAARPRA